MEPIELIRTILVWAIPVLFAVTLHEAAHGYVANHFGDKTALLMGRVTLNPIKHIDLVGTIIVPLIFLFISLTTGTTFIFGWAKPVPVDARNLRNPRRDMALVALAGPFSNFMMALLWTGVAKIFLEIGKSGFEFAKYFVMMGIAGLSINLMLALLNLIPIPPLDGSRVVSSLLNPALAYRYQILERYGFMILLLLIYSNILSYILLPPYNFLVSLFVSLFAIG